MNTKLKKKLCPYLIILFGLLLLFMDMAEVAGVFLLLGIVMIIESIWPEEWKADKINKA